MKYFCLFFFWFSTNNMQLFFSISLNFSLKCAACLNNAISKADKTIKIHSLNQCHFNLDSLQDNNQTVCFQIEYENNEPLRAGNWAKLVQCCNQSVNIDEIGKLIVTLNIVRWMHSHRVALCKHSSLFSKYLFDSVRCTMHVIVYLIRSTHRSSDGVSRVTSEHPNL